MRIAVLAAVLAGLAMASPAGATVSVVLGSSDPDALYLPGETITLTVRATANGGEMAAGALGYIVYSDALLNVNAALNTQNLLPGFDFPLALTCDTVRCRAFNQIASGESVAPNVTNFLLSTTRFIIDPGAAPGSVIDFAWQTAPATQALNFFGISPNQPGYSVTIIPEPSTAALIALGLLGLGLATRDRKQARARLHLGALITWLTVAPSLKATAVTIDFESLPVGEPAVGLSITNQFAASHGVTFSMADGSAFAFGMYGAPSPVAWTLQPPNSGSNLLIAPYDRGSWFAFVDDADTPGRILEIGFSTPVADVSFDLIDIDFGNAVEIDGGREHAVIRAYDYASQLLGSVEISGGDPDTGDGIPTTILLAFGGQQITRIEIEATAWGGGAIDNLSFASIPEPATAALIALGLLALVVARRRAFWPRQPARSSSR